MDIAVIGMAGKFPEANSIDEFYHNLKEGRDSIREISSHRKRATSLSLSDPYRVLAFIEDIDLFDNNFFGISYGEAIHMDPHQRIMMEVVYHLFENAGYSLDDISDSNTGFYCGYSNLKYYEHAEVFDPTLPTGNATSTIARRIARFYNLRGPGIMIDTGCSSSLVALHYACNELILENIDTAIVGGARLVLFPRSDSDDFTKLGTSSPDGKTRSFSDDAEGTGTGEAFGCILLKPLEKALKNNDDIHAVIKGTAVNQDAARSGSLTAPSSASQEELLTKAWKRSGIDPLNIDYIEAHGTGTKLGDPIEIQGITKAFSQFNYPRQFCAISSVKSNIGHTDTAAGVSGIIKTVLSLKHRQLFPAVNFRAPNPFIDFENSPVYVNTSLREWKKEQGLRMACISSFAMSGTNAHAILEEAPTSLNSLVDRPVEDKYHIINVSAKSNTSLLANLSALKEFIELHPEIDLVDISYSLSTKRTHHSQRISFVASSATETLDTVRKYQDLLPEKKEERKDFSEIALIFSGNYNQNIAKAQILLLKNDVFRRAYEDIKSNCTEKNLTNKNIQSLIFEYALYHLIHDLGIDSKILIGSGVGQITAGIIGGKLSLKEGIDSALTLKENQPLTDLEMRTKKLLDKFSGRNVQFVEVGIGGQLPAYIAFLELSDDFRIIISNYEHSEDHWFKSYLSNLYTWGVNIDWKKFYDASKYNKVDLPLYQFDRKRCWLRPFEEERSTLDFYTTRWIESDIPVSEETLENQCLLIFHDSFGVGKAIVDRLKYNNQIINVYHNSDFEIRNDDVYLNLRNEKHYFEIAKFIEEKAQKLTGIFFLSNFKSKNYEDFNYSRVVHHEFYPLYFIARSFDSYLRNKNFRLSLVTTNAHVISENDKSVSPFSNATEGFMKGILSEYRTINMQVIDFRSDVDIAHAAVFFVNSLNVEKRIKFSAYRNRKRFELLLAKSEIEIDKMPTFSIKSDSPVFLVTGGATGIGLEIAKSLAEKYHGTILILGRSLLPKKEDWPTVAPSNTSVFTRTNGLMEIQKAGAELFYYSVDISDKEKMRGVFEDIRKRFSKINGVIHSAGVVMSLTAISDMGLDQLNEEIKPKIEGTIILDEFTQVFNPDFFVTFSSVNALVPRAQSSEYAAACSFQNSYAVSQSLKGKKFISINWPGWSDIQSSTARTTLEKGNDDDVSLKSISTNEGVRAFYTVIALGIANPTVANVDLDKFSVNPFFNTTDKTVPASNLVPDSPISQKIRSINTKDIVRMAWESVLQTQDIANDDDFFALGGHSLNAINVVNYLEKHLSIRVDIDSLLEYPTISEQTEYLNSLIGQEKKIPQIDLMAIEEQEDYGLSLSQQQLWLAHRTSPHKGIFNISTEFKIRGDLNTDALVLALTKLINRHEILRTVILEKDGMPRQKVLSCIKKFSIEFTDLDEDIAEVSAYAQRVEEAKMKPFDLEKQTFRAELIRFQKCCHLLFTIHHICSDFFSMNVLMEELMQAYGESVENVSDQKKELKYQYKDYAIWQRKLLANKDITQSLRSYWSHKFSSGVPLLNLVTDFERPNKRSNRGGRESFIIDTSILSYVNSLAVQLNTTTFTIILASLKVLLHNYTHQNGIVIGSAYGVRPFEELNDQIGYYVRTLPFYTELDPASDFEKTILNVKKTTTDAFVNSMYSIDQIVADLKLAPSPGRNQLFDVMIDFLNISKNKENDTEQALSTNLDVEVVPQRTFLSKYDLTFYFKIFPTSFNLEIEYSSDLFSPDTISTLGNNYLCLLHSIKTHPKFSINKLSFSAGDENDQFESFNNTDIEYSI